MLGSWEDYQGLSERLGDRAIPRITAVFMYLNYICCRGTAVLCPYRVVYLPENSCKYRKGEILLMASLPEHGRDVSLLADIVKVLLDRLEQRYESFTPITMRLPEISGIEPDFCFYIENWRSVVGKNRIDWQNDPPPDLVIEIDVISYTDINDYLPYKVPEIWLFKNKQLLVYRLQGENYAITQSIYFPNIAEIVQQCLQIAKEQTTSEAIRWLQQFSCI